MNGTTRSRVIARPFDEADEPARRDAAATAATGRARAQRERRRRRW